MLKTELYIDVRYYETDQMGIVHHSNYIRYFECGRTAMLKELGLPMEKIEAAGVMMPVVGVECKYKMPARFGDTLKIVTSVDDLPRAKMVIRSEIYNQSGDLCCEGAVTIGFIDSATRRPIRCPESFISVFEANIN
jgi:acyl-CoA thioester hydrolase